MGAIASFLWLKNVRALQEYLKRVPSKVYNSDTLLAVVPQDTRAEIASDAGTRAAMVAAAIAERDWNPARYQLRTARAQVETVLCRGLAEKFRDSMTLVAGLDIANERDGLDLVVLNEDVLALSKTAANWAKLRGVPTVNISHSLIAGRLSTVHLEDNADRLAVFGIRGARGYLGMGMPANRIVVTGNPAWDAYAALIPQRESIRAAFRRQYGLDEKVHLVVFATTWSNYRTAFDDHTRYEVTLRAAVRATRELRDLGVPLRLIVKERPPNANELELRSRIFQEEAGGHDPILVASDLERWVVAADAVISANSNVAIETMIAGTVPIDIWTSSSWLLGPFYSEGDGVLEATCDQLSVVLARALGDQTLRSQLLRAAQARLGQSVQNVGSAAMHVASLMVQTRKTSASERRGYAWEALSSGYAPTGPNGARTEMLEVVRAAPKIAVDFDSGDGMAGALLKRHFPDARVLGVERIANDAMAAGGQVERIVLEDLDRFNADALGIASGSVDLVLCGAALSRLINPWDFLVRLKALLAPGAQIIASIPNARNLLSLDAMASGQWEYSVGGMFDISQIRFFTKKTAADLFVQAGYTVRTISSIPDKRISSLDAADGSIVNIDTKRLQVKNLAANELAEIRALYFIVDASPAT